MQNNFTSILNFCNNYLAGDAEFKPMVVMTVKTRDNTRNGARNLFNISDSPVIKIKKLVEDLDIYGIMPSKVAPTTR
jgi:hypothetical protein